MVCKLCKERGKTWQGDNPICAFDSKGKFKVNNWNCATMNKLRDIAENNNDVRYDCSNEEKTAVLDIDGGILILNWYKDRGKVDMAVSIDTNNKTFKETNTNLCNTIIERNT